MRVHHLQHVPFEGLGSMEPYFLRRGHTLTATHLYLDQRLPSVDDFDWLVVMGGPMGVHDETKYPWLAEELSFIRSAIDSCKAVLGICLGAQLIAAALGSIVERNRYREIGWFPISPAGEATETVLGPVFPASLDVFHWHGDTFRIPDGAARLASSEACENQGFIMEDRVVGLQFHLETTMAGARELISNCRQDLDGSEFVQSESQLLADSARFDRINAVMDSMLLALEAGSGQTGI